MAGKAEARLIYASISTSERVSRLRVKGALVFTWLIAHCDGQGRYAGSERKIKVEVVPFLEEITEDDIEQALKAMEEEMLIHLYTDSQARGLIQVLDWWQWQTGLRIRTPSRYDPPPIEDWQDRITTRDETGRFKQHEAVEGNKEGVHKYQRLP